MSLQHEFDPSNTPTADAAERFLKERTPALLLARKIDLAATLLYERITVDRPGFATQAISLVRLRGDNQPGFVIWAFNTDFTDHTASLEDRFVSFAYNIPGSENDYPRAVGMEPQSVIQIPTVTDTDLQPSIRALEACDPEHLQQLSTRYYVNRDGQTLRALTIPSSLAPNEPDILDRHQPWKTIRRPWLQSDWDFTNRTIDKIIDNIASKPTQDPSRRFNARIYIPGEY